MGKKIGRSQLCFNIEKEGAKMIDVRQYLTALKIQMDLKNF